MDKFIIKNKSGTLLSISIGKYHLRMNPEDIVDLCNITGMGAEELERHPQIAKNKAYNNIVILQKTILSKPIEAIDISQKIEQIMKIVTEKQEKSSITKEDLFDFLKKMKVEVQNTTMDLSSSKFSNEEEEKIKQDLLLKQAEAFNPNIKNKGTFGKNTQSIEVDDLSDLLGD